MATIEEVRKAFEDELQAISVLDQHLSVESAGINRGAFLEGRSLTNEELANRKRIAATRKKLSEAMRTLALETVDALEGATDVDSLIAEVNAVNQQLEEDLAQLEEIEEHAERTRKVAVGFASVVDKLKGLAI